MNVRDVLDALELGSSVAEHDEALKTYFIETQTFKALVNDQCDVIAGDKGTGKTALYRILHERYSQIPELADVVVIPAFNPAGTPVFQRLTEAGVLHENEYIRFWKAYILSLGGNWILSLADGDFTEDMSRLDDLLRAAGLRTLDDTAQTVFSQLMNTLKRIMRIRGVEASATVHPEGIPIIGAKLEFDSDDATPAADLADHDEALRLLDRILDTSDFTLWFVLDRLDEAFQGTPEVERPALRALLRTYLDCLTFQRFKIKLFVRRDLFGRITRGGFVNLTHINARRIDIIWDEEDLESLLHKRLAENPRFIELLNPVSAGQDEVFEAVFPAQVDPGKRKASTWTWMMSRIRDGSGVRPPRNLIDLVLKARDAQLRREERAPREHVGGQPLIEGESLKRGLDALSSERVEDTLLAEAGDNAADVDRFRNGKAEHNDGSLRGLLGDDYADKVRVLRDIGFLEAVGASHKVPILYRGGLNITQGKAFSSGSDNMEDEE